MTTICDFLTRNGTLRTVFEDFGKFLDYLILLVKGR